MKKLEFVIADVIKVERGISKDEVADALNEALDNLNEGMIAESSAVKIKKPKRKKR